MKIDIPKLDISKFVHTGRGMPRAYWNKNLEPLKHEEYEAGWRWVRPEHREEVLVYCLFLVETGKLEKDEEYFLHPKTGHCILLTGERFMCCVNIDVWKEYMANLNNLSL